tara:strand:+ start:241 stop:1380 length:1140 start_codon:yes stop_codon:yes gene_type:complete
MSNLSINADTLKAIRKKFRKEVQVSGGLKQKISHLDNLMTLALGYSHGYGNFAALLKNSPYISALNQVNIMALAKYEVENITCASGVENYLNFYCDMGIDDENFTSFCGDYIVYKFIYHVWDVLSNKSNYQEFIQALIALNTNGENKEQCLQHVSRFIPLCGLFYSEFFKTRTLDDFGLCKHKKQLNNIIVQINNELGNCGLDSNEAESYFMPHLAAFRQSLDFKTVAYLCLDVLQESSQTTMFDVRAWCSFYINCNEDYCIEKVDGIENCKMYLGSNRTLVLFEDWHFHAVLLTEEEFLYIENCFDIHGSKSDITRKTTLSLWNKNLKQGSGTRFSEMQNWSERFKRIKSCIMNEKYITESNYNQASIQSKMTKYNVH